ncbi:bifunctional metallophosphatase/5'-nucleotidase [Aureibacillus halotolerans]|uniref:2',3'-cyclic-nucleotide 2'-phosphodiesterase/3'-nucleotidase n=1 Tax=Aureibacillus halotolerans TaxID=1508390 RepID=A0A4R6UFV3_9BACI|nr:bifunctional UDP-sugar hydrolase/5'-nucleotidase [Aureibacillus halotolerans]TDQ42024.1 2',3'-cyclic-nucleotide 2'-phosphodiesterase/3'-nucleotidase [Aureibacillus halotolerans]
MNKHHVHLLVTSDVHGQYRENGLANLDAVIAKKRKEDGSVFLIDNGDVLQGTPALDFAADQSDMPHPAIAAMNAMRYDMAVVGNHEFNYGFAMLEQAVEESSFPWLSANLVRETSGEPLFGEPYRLLETEQGIRIAVLGVTTFRIPWWEQPSHIEGIRFDEPVSTAKTWVKHIRNKHAPDAMVISYHGGFAQDLHSGEWLEEHRGENQGMELLQIEGIDALITGHQHRSITENNIKGVTVIQPGSHAKQLGEIELVFEKNSDRWSIVSKQAKLHSPEMEASLAVLEATQAQTDASKKWLEERIGTAVSHDLEITDPLQLKQSGHAYVDLIHTVQMQATGAEISVTSMLSESSPGFKEEITIGDVLTNYMFPNMLVVVELTGEVIKEAIEQSVSYFALEKDDIRVSKRFLEPKPQHYNYDFWGGIAYTVCLDRSVGERVTHISHQGKPLDPKSVYSVAMNHYRAAGGGMYPMLTKGKLVDQVPTRISRLLIDYIKETGTLHGERTHEGMILKKTCNE